MYFKDGNTIERGVSKDTIEGPAGLEENRFTRLYREIVRRNAKTVAAWQAYGFTNGVLNTDNTSIFGLSIDFGPFAFLDNFDPNYTPNHDDHMLRYSYRNQPTIIWWNLVRLGESLGELIGAGANVDDTVFIEKGVREEDADEVVSRAEAVITRIGEEYKSTFLAEYQRLMTARLGLKVFRESDFETLYSELLDTMQSLELDFNQFFRKLSSIPISALETSSSRKEVSTQFFHHEGVTGLNNTLESATTRLSNWLEKWQGRIYEDWGPDGDDENRMIEMNKVNPKFIPRGWVLDEIIKRVDKGGEREVLNRVMKMVSDPFKESWDGDREEEERWCGDVPRGDRAMQCSCSSCLFVLEKHKLIVPSSPSPADHQTRIPTF
ncbi:hypothetical protein EYC84_001749 [Monilinia fructicola]|uniref:Selenoprotein O n=1 Tax=Monilinia fructicola TaxID=38448 RepID=A0A5M9JT35_MONFR|nr:hypothetical protein EYC84_001749 [Monilinia fructicola]